ncbi:hypothetical protein [Flavobacterium sp. HSC-61S13]|uniref:hypothetical protein n=1 Tax=Flavobacterium sp. HSC-61S13 TaxID=2910963 RepID=UPI00209CF412|nr:hypothetical protein [Flavobacterium sp. HSC-61S13]MCP1996656.1 hypothetical protein [Flavobacterium sp. HSC-61S13]
MSQEASTEENNENPDLPNLGNEGAGNNTTTEVSPLTEEAVLSFLKDKGRDVTSLDELLKTPEPVIETREVNPWEELADDEDKAYFKFKQETGRGREEFKTLNQDLNAISPIEFARERVRQETGSQFTDEQIDEYLENQLGIESLEDLSSSDSIKLAGYGKTIKDARISEQEKFKQPVKKVEPTTPTNQDEFVKLHNGAVIKKSDYEVMVSNHQTHIKNATDAVNSVTAASFKTVIDDNGVEKELNFAYEYSDEDRGSAISIVSDIDKFIQENYHTEKGFNHKSFGEDVFWLRPENREKAISSIIQKARAEAIEETLKVRGNVNFTNQEGLTTPSKYGVTLMSLSDLKQK